MYIMSVRAQEMLSRRNNIILNIYLMYTPTGHDSYACIWYTLKMYIYIVYDKPAAVAINIYDIQNIVIRILL